MEAIQFLNTTPEELKNSLISELKELLKPKEEELLTQKEVAAFYKVTTATIIDWTKKGIVKCYSINNERRYKKSELLGNLILMK